MTRPACLKPGWITVEEAAEILDVDISQVSRYITRGSFPSSEKIGRSWVLLEDEVRCFEKQPRGNPALQN